LLAQISLSLTHAHARARTHAHTHARTHTCTHPHTQPHTARTHARTTHTHTYMRFQASSILSTIVGCYITYAGIWLLTFQNSLSVPPSFKIPAVQGQSVLKSQSITTNICCIKSNMSKDLHVCTFMAHLLTLSAAQIIEVMFTDQMTSE
jgi:hypothetical protein